jgi:hypothetical protein
MNEQLDPDTVFRSEGTDFVCVAFEVLSAGECIEAADRK